MACYEKNVVATAIAEIGYQETPKGSNKNKYASYIDKNFPNFYNGAKNGSAAWCDIFVDYCVLVNCADEAEAEYVLCQPKKSCGAGCRFSYDYYKEKGRAGKEPRIGAQIFFGSSKPTHTGIVIDLNNDSVFTVEGNSDDCVKKHSYKRNSSRIFGYGYPRYSEANTAPAPTQPAQPAQPAPTPTPAPAPAPAPTPAKQGYSGAFPKLPARGYFQRNDKGSEVTKMQKVLEWAQPGCLPKYGADGYYGLETVNAVKVVQQKLGLKVDGLYGKATQKALMNYKK